MNMKKNQSRETATLILLDGLNKSIVPLPMEDGAHDKNFLFDIDLYTITSKTVGKLLGNLINESYIASFYREMPTFHILTVNNTELEVALEEDTFLLLLGKEGSNETRKSTVIEQFISAFFYDFQYSDICRNEACHYNNGFLNNSIPSLLSWAYKLSEKCEDHEVFEARTRQRDEKLRFSRNNLNSRYKSIRGLYFFSKYLECKYPECKFQMTDIRKKYSSMRGLDMRPPIRSWDSSKEDEDEEPPYRDPYARNCDDEPMTSDDLEYLHAFERPPASSTRIDISENIAPPVSLCTDEYSPYYGPKDPYDRPEAKIPGMVDSLPTGDNPDVLLEDPSPVKTIGGYPTVSRGK